MTEHRSPMHRDEISVHDATVRSLLSSQFPQWSAKPLERLPDSGTDSAIYRLGDTLGVRLPRTHWAVQQVELEWKWLRGLAPSLPTSIPAPIAKGKPGEGYPYPWLVYPWIDGESLDAAPVDEWGSLATSLAAFVRALETVSVPVNAPTPRRRGGPLTSVDREARRAIRNLRGVIDVDRATQIWNAAVDADAWMKDPVWIHGDLLPGNILIRDQKLVGVIDWSGVSVGDPACEAMLTWSLPPHARQTFRQTLGFDGATWARARGWVVEQTAMYIPYYEKTLPHAVAQAKLRLEAALNDPDG